MKYGLLIRPSIVVVLTLGVAAGALSVHSPTARAAGQKPAVAHQQLETVTATIVSIDRGERVITLRGPAGHPIAVWVDPSASNLSAFKVGDHVTVRYYESLVIQARKPAPGEKTSIHGMGATFVSDERGQTPAAVAAHQVQATARVMAIDKPRGLITLKGSQGNIRTFQLENPTILTNVTVGDLIVFTYTAARALSIAKA